MMNFDRCLKFTLRWEGGYVNHPLDPGGPTNMGITQKTYEQWVGHKVTPTDIALLTEENIQPIYKELYWNKVSGDSLPNGIDLLAFDFAVNSGPSRAVMELQKIYDGGLSVDGIIGPITLATVKEDYEYDPKELIDDYCDQRMIFLQSLATFSTFGRGWTKRVEAARKEAKRMV